MLQHNDLHRDQGLTQRPMYTFIFVALFAVLSLGSLLAWFWAFRLGIRWAGAENITWKRLALAFFASAGLQLVAGFALAFLELAIPFGAVFSEVAVWVVWMLCLAGGAMIVFKLPRGRALKSTWPPLAVTALSAALPIFVLKPFVVEAFKTPSTSMAPTLVGAHRTATCPKCGSPAYGSPEDNPRGLPMICEHFHVSQIDAESSPRLPSWRFAVGKLLEPQRWDFVVFRYPEDPKTLFVMRLVGLPGEEITIRDGALWADGKQLELPKELERIPRPDSRLPRQALGRCGKPSQVGRRRVFRARRFFGPRQGFAALANRHSWPPTVCGPTVAYLWSRDHDLLAAEPLAGVSLMRIDAGRARREFMKIAVFLLAIGLSVACSESNEELPRTDPSQLSKTALKSASLVPLKAPDSVLEVSAGGHASLSAPVELVVSLANKGTTPLIYFLRSEAFTIAVRNADDGKECAPTELGRSRFAAPRTGILMRNASVKLLPGETKTWKVDLREQFQLSAATYEVDVGFRLQVRDVGRINVVSPPIQIVIE